MRAHWLLAAGFPPAAAFEVLVRAAALRHFDVAHAWDLTAVGVRARASAD
jgi:hypothetical protein